MTRTAPLLVDRKALETLPNPYWDTVKPHLVMPSKDPRKALIYGSSPTIGDLLGEPQKFSEIWELRRDMVTRYAWSITDPGAVAFVAGHSNGRIVDPIAGTGYWAKLLSWLGVKVHACDVAPPQPDQDLNRLHPRTEQHVRVLQNDAADAVREAGRRHTLSLSWPPFNEDTADRTLAAYEGDKVIYIGEGMGGCTGDDAFHERLDKDWEEIDSYPITQWSGLHDTVTVWARNNNSPAA